MTVDFRIFANVVTMLLDYFLDVRKVTECNSQVHFDIEIKREDDFHSIYVTNCDCGAGDFRKILGYFFITLRPRFELNCYFKTITTFVKPTNDEEWAYDLRYPKKNTCAIVRRSLKSKESRRFENMNEYQSFTLKCILRFEDVEEFRKYLSRSIEILANSHKSSFDAKYTFHCGEQMIYQNYVELTKTGINCNFISSAIKSVLTRSLNSEFRTRCLQLLGVRYSDEAGEAVMSKLLSLIPENSRGKKRKNELSAASTIAEKVNKRQTKNDESNDKTMENEKENNQANSDGTLPIIMPSKGRTIKRTTIYHEMNNITNK